jgi:hypothetical protein
MRKKVIRLLLFCLMACPFLAIGQPRTLRGVIVDANRNPVAEASITEKGTTNGTTSDASGNFVLTVRPNAVLVVSIVGLSNRRDYCR